MKLPFPFYKLPLQLDVARLRAEMGTLSADAWVSHPKGVPGNSAVRLITVNGEDNDSLYGTMLPTRYLATMPYTRQVLSSFGVVWGRSRLMKLAPGAEVPEHSDINLHWFRRVQLHMPVFTTPEVKFSCDEQTVHMAAGDVWVFDNWRPHRVINPSESERIHLVADTTGNSVFWRRVLTSNGGPATTLTYQEGANPPLLTERNSTYSVMSPTEVELLLSDLAEEIVARTAQSNSGQSVAEYRQLLTNFILDWRHCCLRFGEDAAHFGEYIKLRESLQADSLRIGPCLMVRSNSVAAHEVLAARILRQLLGTSETGRAPTRAGSAGSNQPSTRNRFFRPVFIVAAPRAGSTLLYEALAVNSSFCTLGGEAHWLVENIPSLRPGWPGVDSNRLTGSHATDAIAEHVAESILRRAMSSTHESVKLSASGLRLLEKTPKNAIRIPFLNEIFSDARFIFLWRDPRENISSIMEAWKGGRWITYKNLPGWDGPWSMLLPPGWRDLRGRPLEEVAAYQWRYTNETVLADLHQLAIDRFAVVNYTDLLSNPRGTIERLCAFTGVEMDDATMARVSAPLPLSRYTQTPVDPGKWKRNEAPILRVLPTVNHVWRELQMLTR